MSVPEIERERGEDTQCTRSGRKGKMETRPEGLGSIVGLNSGSVRVGFLVRGCISNNENPSRRFCHFCEISRRISNKLLGGFMISSGTAFAPTRRALETAP